MGRAWKPHGGSGDLNPVGIAPGPLLRVLVSVFAPIYWTTVLQTGATRNGYSVTQGQFRQESQLEFETGEDGRRTPPPLTLGVERFK